MANLSDFLEATIIDHLLRNQAYTPPTTIFLGLSTTTPADDGTGVTEPVGSGYAREALALDAASGGVTANSAQIDFVASGGNWGLITHIVVYDALTVGNLLLHGAMAVSRTINDGDTLRFSIGDIDLTID
jgi:hypothetical protein